ncbi:transcription initiation factor TFIID subunit 3 [Drosophila simulans]|uniref:GD23216 n=1 Tax=Drosophila simulans TaxID=7240 RepID=B4Q950_DROSI|nr:transcription initiation factor TFIID subunit 3 [Drosophila simulans]EDX03589.1 GD23216 [Drosophila simulans]KMY87835.1 uncharacterized protein Dsimw501_GD23216 [Drosophila simulans]
MVPVQKSNVSGEADSVVSAKDVYCICRQSHSNGFMICCDNCNEWFHGDCIGLPASIGVQHDTYYCTECFRKNPLLKCTYKKSSSTSGVPKTPKTPKTPKSPKTPKRARIINSVGVRQNPRRRSTFVQEPLEVHNPSTPAPKASRTRRQSTKLQKAVEYENATEEAKKVDQKPKRTAKEKNPKPEDKVTGDAPKPTIKKVFVSTGTQCNMFREFAKYVPPENSKKKGTCSSDCCQRLARLRSNYCCDECNNLTAVINLASFGVLPKIPPINAAMARQLKQYGIYNYQIFQNDNDSANNHKSNKKSKASESETKTKTKAKKTKSEERKSRYRSPSSSPDVSPTAAKKPKLQEELHSSRSKSSRKLLEESESETEPQQKSKHKTAKEERTSSQRTYSLSPKSSRNSRNTSKTAPNTPVNLKNTFKIKHVTSSPPSGQKRVRRSQTISVDGPLTSEPKSTEVSRMASPGTSSRNMNPVLPTSYQKYRKLSLTDEKIKAIRCIVSNMSKDEKAELARKRMMIKLASEKHLRQATGDLNKEKYTGAF